MDHKTATCVEWVDAVHIDMGPARPVPSERIVKVAELTVTRPC